ncbi:YceI family protein [Halomonas daqiaonensis]|uniref:Polyisoprenoid-binding protein YceI n=1 Tax=Halomonas daqiaonensis TaxID=650850 RepID=A0A1H7TF68_9GAMM|nr:YceI family protein [Halomonas daqiaonensis]SEL82946.1 Polyisoprenoid-binding protein YceI [Halomonas daqiaonensis]
MSRFTPRIASLVSIAPAILLSGLLVLMSVSPAAAWELDQDASRIELIGTADGREAVTRVEDFELELEGDLDQPADGHLVLTLQSASITGGNDIVDGMLHGHNWFDVENYPEIVFRSTDIQAPAEGELRIEGELELRGDTYPLTVPASWTQQGERVSVSGRLTLDRTDFDMGRGAWRTEGTVLHEVHVDFALELLATSRS